MAQMLVVMKDFLTVEMTVVTTAHQKVGSMVARMADRTVGLKAHLTVVH